MTQASSLEEDVYNLTVTILGMCVNKELSITLSDTENVSVEEFPDKLKEIYSAVFNKYTGYNETVTANLDLKVKEAGPEFLEYLNQMVKILLSGVKYIEKKKDEPWHLEDEVNEWNSRYRREERIRDYMKSLVSVEQKYTVFTIKHKIELPYLYTLAWDLPNLLKYYEKLKRSNDTENKEDKSYIGNLRENTKIALKHVSENMLDILLNGIQYDCDKFEDAAPNAALRFYKKVSYKDLLPTIRITEKVDYSDDLQSIGARAKARRDHILPYIKKEILQKKPLIPMELSDNKYDAEKLIKMMVDVLKEENKTKDYLSSDIVDLKTVITKICEMILEWIWSDEGSFQIDPAEAEAYLLSIAKAVSNMPRENTKKNREDHLEKITTVIAKKWDSVQLKEKSLDEGDPETYIRYAYFSVLKLARNWNEHNLIKEPSITFVVFLFLIAVRYTVDIDQLDMEHHREYLFEESKLFKYFKKGKIEYSKINVEDIVEKEYLNAYQAVKKNAIPEGEGGRWANRFPKNQTVKDPHQVLNTAGYTRSLIKDKMSEYEIYLTFWLSLHFADNKGFRRVAESKDLNFMELVERTFNYQKESFLLAITQTVTE